MTLLALLNAIIGALTGAGAHHLTQAHAHGSGYVASQHWLVFVCHIPQHLHGTLKCSGWIRR